MNNLIEAGLQTYKENLVKENLTNIPDILKHFDVVYVYSKLIAIEQFEEAKKMGNKKQQLKFQKELENKIDQTFSEWKVGAIHNYEILSAEVKITKEKEAENKRLEKEKLKTYQEYENQIKEVQKNNAELTECTETAKYNEIVVKLKMKWLFKIQHFRGN